MNILRNRFLNTSALLLDPRESASGDAGNDQGGADAGNEGTSGEADATAQGDADAGNDAGDTDGDAGGEDDTDDTDGGADDEDDPDLADLPPEAKAKAKAAIARRVAKETGWRDKQIDRLHAKRRAAEDEAAAAATIVGRTAAAGSDDPNRKFTAEELKVEAARIAAQSQYDRDCDATFQQGASTFGDKWKDAITKLPKLGGVDVTDMVDILATDKPHVVLYQMADPEVYERVMALPPARRRTEFVKLSLKPEPKAAPKNPGSKRPSDAVPPVTPISGTRRTAAQAVDLHDDKVSDDAWYAARNATRRKKFSNVA